MSALGDLLGVELGPTSWIEVTQERIDAFAGTHHAADGGSSSLSSAQKLYVPACVGRPLMVPLDESERPGGSAPLMTRY